MKKYGKHRKKQATGPRAASAAPTQSLICKAARKQTEAVPIKKHRKRPRSGRFTHRKGQP